MNGEPSRLLGNIGCGVTVLMFADLFFVFLVMVWTHLHAVSIWVLVQCLCVEAVWLFVLTLMGKSAKDGAK